MNNYSIWRGYLKCISLAVLTTLLLSCSATIEQNETTVVNTSTATMQPTFTAVSEVNQADLSVSTTPEQSNTPSVTATMTPLASATPSPTLTNTPIPTNTATPWPTAVTVPCVTANNLPGKVFPTQIDMTRSHNQRVAIAYPFLYLAVEQYIGVFDISEPASPRFWGFWDFPDWPEISTLQVDNGIIYFTSGTTLVMLNASPQCQFETIATMDVPYQVFQLQIENNRLYLGGVLSDIGRRQVTIFSIDGPGQLEELGLVDLGQEPAVWSVFNETIYSLGDNFTLINVSDPTNLRTQEGSLALDSDILRFSPSQFLADRLYLLWEGRYVTSISNLQSESPVTTRNPLEQIVMGDLTYFVFQVSENYIFLGGYACDGISCGSYITFFDSKSAEKLSGFGFYDNLVHSYYEVQPNIIYAFTSEYLLVIDLSNLEEPKIIAELPLIT
jgi:hypothetical protein